MSLPWRRSHCGCDASGAAFHGHQGKVRSTDVFFHPEMSKYPLKLRNNKLIFFTKFLSSFSDQQFFLRAQFFQLKGQTKLWQMPLLHEFFLLFCIWTTFPYTRRVVCLQIHRVGCHHIYMVILAQPFIIYICLGRGAAGVCFSPKENY